MLTERRSGVLLHPTSLPGRFGIGDLGLESRRFIEWLAAAHQTYWQVLPLGPTAEGDSPYQSPSSFAGNPLLVSPDLLFKDLLLTAQELVLAELPAAEGGWRVDFSAVTTRKMHLLETAASRLTDRHALSKNYRDFCRQQATWLPQVGEFLALSEANGGQAWWNWTECVDDQFNLTETGRNHLQSRIDSFQKQQFLFFHQWSDLRSFGRLRGIQIVGDVPIYVSQNSADVWANRRLFQLNEKGRPTRVAGVPPDYFSATGQLWNNPLYNWDAMADENHQWWTDRLRAVLQLVDIVRIDHFRAFESYWSVPSGETTAINGEWVPGPKERFFADIAQGLHRAGCGNGELASLPLIAEDLGMITEEVNALRRHTALPGMKVLQFMLPGDLHSLHDVEQLEANSITYTGTHDNDTSLGWYQQEIKPDENRRNHLAQFIGTPIEDLIPRGLVELAWRSGSLVAIAPIQDLLGLGSRHRMNTPGTFGAEYRNWQWRLPDGLLNDEVQSWLTEITCRHRRAPG